MKGSGGFGNRMTWKVEYLPEALADLGKRRAENKVYDEAGSRCGKK